MLLGDIADVKRLKQEDGPDLVTQGSTELVRALLANDLVDAMSIFTVPVVLGGGSRPLHVTTSGEVQDSQTPAFPSASTFDGRSRSI